MTDTDDTDELLLIPPDFFAVESDSGHTEIVQPYYNIVDNLIRQVDSIQNRLQSIESSESFCSNSLESESLQRMDNTKQRLRRYNSTDDLHTSMCTQNSPQKLFTRFKLNSLPNSPNIDRFLNTKNYRSLYDKLPAQELQPVDLSRKYSKSGKDDQVINEIDTFLSKVKTIQRMNAVRNLEHDFNCCSIRSDQPQHSNSSKESVFRQKDTDDVKETDLPRRKESDIQIPHIDESRENKYSQDSTLHEQVSSADSSSDSTQVTAYKGPRSKSNLVTNSIHTNALNILNVHKQLTEDSSRRTKTKESFGDHKKRYKTTIVEDKVDTPLSFMNLADIWNSNNHALTKDQLTQKLEEERYRRQHCEDLIHELQGRNLELQQKISVAIKVDETKNITIKKYQEALEKLIFRLENINKEKIDQEFEINRLKNQHVDEKEDVSQKLACYEKEISRILNLAQTSQEQSSTWEKRCSELTSANEDLTKKLESLEQNYSKECERFKQMSDILAQKEIELNENKGMLTTARSEIAQSREAVESCQSEFNKMKDEYIKMENSLKNEKNQTTQLNKNIVELSKEIESYKKQQKSLQEEIAKSKKQLESSKVELRNFYQGQVEILVQNKLKEFQCELEDTENKYKNELNKREMAIAKSAATHIQQISEKHNLEVKLLEKKHVEESKLYQIQVVQYKQQAEHLQNQLDLFQARRITVVRQLQKVMESQWNEALRIITSNKSPSFNDESAFSTIDQLNSLKTRSYNNLEEVLSQHNGSDRIRRGTNNDRDDTGSTSEKEVLNEPIETPMSSRIPTDRPLTGADIQKFLNLIKEDGNIANQRGHSKDSKGPKPPWK